MAGGHATTAGIGHQCEVGAWIAERILCKTAIAEIGPGLPRSIQLETTHPVDDIVVQTDSGGFWFINAKTVVSISALPKSPLSSVADQFVRQWLYGVVDNSIPNGHRAIDITRDRLILAVKAGGSGQLVSGLKRVLRRLSEGASRIGSGKSDLTIHESETLAVVKKQINYHWNRQKGFIIDDETFEQILSCVRIVEIDHDLVKAESSVVLGSIVAPESIGATHEVLVKICMEFAENRSGGDISTLREALLTRRVRLKGRPQVQSDIRRLQEITVDALADLSRYNSIQIQGAASAIEIKRDCVNAIVSSALDRKSILVIGEPGAGKSGALFSASKNLQNEGGVVVTLQVDQLEGVTLEALRLDLGLENPLADVFVEWNPEGPAFLVIDALDASRGVGAEASVRRLIGEILQRARHWTVIASIRKFDLRYGAQYHDLFQGLAPSEEFRDEEFATVSHINIPRLSESEINQICDQWPALTKMVERSSLQFRELLHSPFNLYLLGRTLGHSIDDDRIANSQLDLLGNFWKRRVDGRSFAESEESSIALEKIVNMMLEKRRLTMLINDDPSINVLAIERLLGDGVLYRPHNSRRLQFAHHVLFDFAVAKLAILTGEDGSIGESFPKLIADVLLIAPALVIALRSRWESEESRESFWLDALKIAEDKIGGPFLRTLPAKVAAESIQKNSDIEPLVLSLKKKSTADAANALSRDVLAVLFAGVISGRPKLEDASDPWCSIAETFANASASTLLWPLNSVVLNWSMANLPAEQKLAINKTARILLSTQKNLGGQYAESVASSAIRGIGRTFDAAPVESAQAIREILSPERVAIRGYKELFWVADVFSSIVQADAELAAQILLTAFSTPLPSSEEKTSIGDSRILQLTSTKRQDFQGALHSFERQIPAFIESSSLAAAPAIRALVIAMVNREHVTRSSYEPVQIRLGDRSLNVVPDLSCVWWSPSDRGGRGNEAIIDRVLESLTKLNALNFQQFANVFLNGEIPAILLTILLRASKSRGEKNALVFSLLEQAEILSMMDLSYDAGELLTSKYDLLESNEAERVQEAISLVKDEHRQRILLACLPENSEIVNPELKKLSEQSSEDTRSPKNSPHFSIHSSWGGNDENWWLREQGVDVDDPETVRLLESIKGMNSKDLPADKKAASEELEVVWRQVLASMEKVNLLALHKTLRDKLLDAVSEVAQTICEKSESPIELERFPSLRETIDICLMDELSPERVRDEEGEKSFAQSAGWGRPAPRVEAAGALMMYVRAKQSASEDDVERILSLARDPAVAVRHTILSRSNVVCIAAPELAERLADIAFHEERNRGVLTFFLSSYSKFMGQNIVKASENILKLAAGKRSSDEKKSNDLLNWIVGLTIRLWITWGVEPAQQQLKVWIQDPIQYSDELRELIGDMRNLISYGDPIEKKGEDELVRRKGHDLFAQIIDLLVVKCGELLASFNGGRADAQESLGNVIQLLDHAAHQLYFGSGAYDFRNSQGREGATPSKEVRLRFIDEYLPILTNIARSPYPSITHPILEIIEAFLGDAPEEMLGLLLATVQSGAKDGGYHFEVLGADLVVKIARKLLADHSNLLLSKSEYRAGLLDVLNMFASVGWPEAQKLVYELPEMLR